MLPPFGTAAVQGLVQFRSVSADQVYAAAAALRARAAELDDPPGSPLHRLADLLESVETARKLGSAVPPLVVEYFVDAVLSLTAVPAEDGSPAVGAGGPG